MGIEPTTEGTLGGSKPSDRSGDVGSVRESQSYSSGCVGMVLRCRIGMWDETWDLNCGIVTNE